jgi:hypothetical protein
MARNGCQGRSCFHRKLRAGRIPTKLVLDALCAARFAVCCIEHRHDIAGLIASDLLRNTEVWLMDLSLEATTPRSSQIAAHLITLDDFSMTTGLAVPVDRDVVEDAPDDLPTGRAGASGKAARWISASESFLIVHKIPIKKLNAWPSGRTMFD